MGSSKLRCVVEGCQGRGGHVFPRNLKRKLAWLKAVKWADSKDPHPAAVVCHQHFLETDYRNSQVDLQTFVECGTLGKNRRLRLRRSAVPSVFLNENPLVQQINTEQDGELLIEITDENEVSEVSEDSYETIIVVGDCEEIPTNDDVVIIEEDTVSYEYPRGEPPSNPNYDYETDDVSDDDSPPISYIIKSVHNDLQNKDSACIGELHFNSRASDRCAVDEIVITEFLCNDCGIEIESIRNVPVTYSKHGSPIEICEENTLLEDGSQILYEDGRLQGTNSEFNVSNETAIVIDEDLNSKVPSCKTDNNPKEAFVTTFKMTKKYISVKSNELKGKSAKAPPKIKSAQLLAKIKPSQPLAKFKPLPKITLMRKGTNDWVVGKKLRYDQKSGNLLRGKLGKKLASTNIYKRKRRAKRVGPVKSNALRKRIAQSKIQPGDVSAGNESSPDLLLQPDEPLPENPCVDATIPLKRITELEPLSDLSMPSDERLNSPQYPCIDVSDDDSYSSNDVAKINQSSASQSSESIETSNRNALSFIGELTQQATASISTLSIQHQILHQVAMKVGSSAKQKILDQLAKSERTVISHRSDVEKVPSIPTAASHPSAPACSDPLSYDSPEPLASIAQPKPVISRPNSRNLPRLKTKPQPKNPNETVEPSLPNMKTKSISDKKSNKKINTLKNKTGFIKQKPNIAEPHRNISLLSKAFGNSEPLLGNWTESVPENAQFLGSSKDKTFYIVEDATIYETEPASEVSKSPPRKLVEEWGDSDEDEDYLVPDSKNVNPPAAPQESDVIGNDDCAIIDNPLEVIDLCEDDDCSNGSSKNVEEADPTVDYRGGVMQNVNTCFQERRFSISGMKQPRPAGVSASGSVGHEVDPSLDSSGLAMKEVRTSFQERHFTFSKKQHQPSSISALSSVAKIISSHSDSAAKIVMPPTKIKNIIWNSATCAARPPPKDSRDHYVKGGVTLAGDTALSAFKETLIGKPIVTQSESSSATKSVVPSNDFGWMALPPTPDTSPNRSPLQLPVERTRDPIYLDELLAETIDEITISSNGIEVASNETIHTLEDPPNQPTDSPHIDSAAPTTVAALPVSPPLETPIRCDQPIFESLFNKELRADGVDGNHEPSIRGTTNSMEGLSSNMVTNEESVSLECPDTIIFAGAAHELPSLGSSNPTEALPSDKAANAEPPAPPMPSAELHFLANVAVKQSSPIQFARFSSSVNCSSGFISSRYDGTVDAAEVDVHSEILPQKQYLDLASLSKHFILLPINKSRFEPSLHATEPPKLPLTKPPMSVVAGYEHIVEDHCYFSPNPPPKVNKPQNRTVKPLNPKKRSHPAKRAHNLHADSLIGDAKRRKWAVILKRLSSEELEKYSPAGPTISDQDDGDSDFGEALEQTCYHCEQDFASLKVLKQHISWKHKYNQLICPHCYEGFLCPVKCNEHIRDVHKQTMSEITYACTQCDFTTNDHCALGGHIDVVHNTYKTPRKACSEYPCIFKCTSDAAMEEHMEKCHRIGRHSGNYVVSNIQDMIGEEIMPLPIGVPVSNRIPNNESVSGPVTQRSVDRDHTLLLYGSEGSNLTHPIESVDAGACVLRPSAEFNMETVFGNTSDETASDPLKVPCPHCPSMFKKLADLGKHIVRVHICPICDRVFSDLSSLKRHMRSSHTTPKCPVCRERFSENLLTQHVRLTHPDYFHQTVWCKFCPFASMGEPAVELHYVIIHKTTEFPDKCPLCKSTSTRFFANVKDLLLHTSKFHHEVHNEVTLCN